ncbi:MAG: YlxR family protein [Anaerolineaceae bacterium]|nr:YlxR family protein [Anaerolineaceae bacterium]MDI9531002.1 YlxR family protein [Chloroflexota bacterium]NLE92704.1 YlxR family protein [Chloroflexota bacterium]HNZ15642.1 YlxR family protein [Anaerolineaceae bacterium]HOF28387.1 YlxR family protein [Anaerolineaceae bacterium]
MAAKTARKVKHVPQRTCVGCKQVLPKRQLTRVVRSSEGVMIDPSGKLPGRGAYLHDLKSCWVKALKGSLAHALRTSIQEQDLVALRTFMETLPESETPDEESMTA